MNNCHLKGRNFWCCCQCVWNIDISTQTAAVWFVDNWAVTAVAYLCIAADIELIAGINRQTCTDSESVAAVARRVDKHLRFTVLAVWKVGGKNHSAVYEYLCITVKINGRGIYSVCMVGKCNIGNSWTVFINSHTVYTKISTPDIKSAIAGYTTVNICQTVCIRRSTWTADIQRFSYICPSGCRRCGTCVTLAVNILSCIGTTIVNKISAVRIDCCANNIACLRVNNIICRINEAVLWINNAVVCCFFGRCKVV